MVRSSVAGVFVASIILGALLAACGGGGGGADSGPAPAPQPAGYVVSTVAGTKATSGTSLSDRGVDGPAATATFDAPSSAALDAAGNLYIADSGYAQVRKLSRDGVVTTIAGPGAGGYQDGPVATALFSTQLSIAVAPDGTVFVADYFNNCIRKISTDGQVSTLAGAGPNATGFANGTGTAARFAQPQGIVIDHAGNLFVSDSFPVIRKITPDGVVTSFVGTMDKVGYVDGHGTAAQMTYDPAIAIDAQDNLYFVQDELLPVGRPPHGMLRKVTPNADITSSDIVGVGTDSTGLSLTSLGGATAIAADSEGNLFVFDSTVLRKITRTGQLLEVAGRAEVGSTDGVGSSATFGNPEGMVVDASGRIYVADMISNRIRVVTPE